MRPLAGLPATGAVAKIAQLRIAECVHMDLLNCGVRTVLIRSYCAYCVSAYCAIVRTVSVCSYCAYCVNA